MPNNLNYPPPSPLVTSVHSDHNTSILSLSVFLPQNWMRPNWRSSWVMRLHHVAWKLCCVKLMKVRVIVCDEIGTSTKSDVLIRCLFGTLWSIVSPVIGLILPQRRSRCWLTFTFLSTSCSFMAVIEGSFIEIAHFRNLYGQMLPVHQSIPL